MDKNLESEKLNENLIDETAEDKNVENKTETTQTQLLIEEGKIVAETEDTLEEDTKTLEEETKTLEEDTTKSEENSKPTKSFEDLTKGQIIELLKNLKMQEEIPTRQEVDALKQAYHTLRKAEIDAEKAKFEENTEEDEEFIASVDPSDDVLKVYLNDIKDKRAKKIAEENKERETNYKIKLEIIESIKALTESTDDFNKLFKEFKELQQKWNTIKLVPQSKIRELWAEYQIESEKFYDLVKINNELRDYDFKKNMDLKAELCEAAEKLVEGVDSVSAFHQLQNLHQQWREIGPVAREHREELWGRFKDISTQINKNYQGHFESLKGLEEENLVEKTAIIDELKTIDYSKIQSYRDWDKKTKEVLELQSKWRTIGFVPHKVNAKIFEEFRQLCDVFFETKSGFFKVQREQMDENLAKKRTLTDKALALKDSTDWKKSTDLMIQLQKEWKTIGPVARKYSDVIWKEFIGACDHFFDERKKHFSTQKNEEGDNYKAKTEIVEKIKNLDQSLETSELMKELRDLQDLWHKIGFVPYKDKDRSYQELYAAVDAHYERLKINKDERRFEEFKSNVEDRMATKENPERALSRERTQLTYQYNKLKSDLQTYENNMSFLTVSSKGKDNPLLKDVNKKIESLKSEMELIEKKVETIDSSLKDIE